jgi:hypothetical protein
MFIRKMTRGSLPETISIRHSLTTRYSKCLMFSVFAVTLQSDAHTNSRPVVPRTVPDTPPFRRDHLVVWFFLNDFNQSWNELWLGENYVIS